MTQTGNLHLPATIALVLLMAMPAPALSQSQDSGKAGSRRAAAPSNTPVPKDDGPYERDERAEAVLQDAIKAHGGATALQGRQTIYIKYKVTNYDYPEPQEGTITLWFKRPTKIRQEVAYSNRREIRVYDGSRAWVDGGDGPRLMGGLMAWMMERGTLELDSPLLYSQGSLRYLSLAKDPMGRLTQKLSWRHQGYARDLMVDVSTNRILMIGEFDTPAGAISRIKIYDDFRPVQGIVIPWHQTVLRNNQTYSETEILEVSFNVPVDDSLFEYTGPEAAPETASPGTPSSRPKL